MEQHPVPQNVTTFQFRLIGDMTLKQFGYLCAGAILAFVAYKLPMPFIITWPLTMAFAFLGIGFAFIPIEERPMDVWVFSFFKSIYSPTQYLWTREAPKVAQPPTQAVPSSASPAVPSPNMTQPVPIVKPQETQTVSVPSVTGTPISQPLPPPQAPTTPKTTAVLSDLFRPTAQTAAPAPSVQHAPVAHRVLTTSHHVSIWDQIMAFFTITPKPRHIDVAQQPTTTVHTQTVAIPSVTGARHAPPTQSAVPTQEKPRPAEDHVIHEKMARLEENISNLEAKLKTTSSAEDRVLELQKQLTEVLEQKTKTDDELSALKRVILAKPDPTPPSPPGAPERRGSVNVITTQEGAVKAGLPRLTNVPNVITGIVKDDEGNLLPGILVTVTNTDGVPMRALKTNKLGQFGASTPLASGTYFVEIEDPRARFTFSRVQLTLSGAVLPILEILAKSEKVLNREKLTKEIFGTPNT